MNGSPTISRRSFLKGTGALIVAFSLPVELRAQTGNLPTNFGGPLPPRQIDSWLVIAQDGSVTVQSGKVELGTGVSTALRQIVAEELDFPFERIIWVQADKVRTVDQLPTTGSETIKTGGAQMRQAAAEARQVLVELASTRLGAPVERLVVSNGVISVKGDPSKKVSYGELIGGDHFNREVTGRVKPKSPDSYRLVGTSVKRVDISGKVTGTYAYIQDVRLPGMLHGRVVRPAGVSATLISVDENSVRNMPGVQMVRKENFVGVVAEREDQAIRAARELKVAWRESSGLPQMKDLHEMLRKTPSTSRELAKNGDVEAALASATKLLKATYRWPFQSHGSIGPSCGVADVRNGEATIWSGTQGAHQLRPTIAQLLGLSPENVRVIFVEASGCYGHNGADDAAADAALLSQAVGKPVRVQWMRHDEHGWEPTGPAMVMDVRAGLDAQGNVVAWDYAAWTPTHSSRPSGQAASLLAGQLAGAPTGRTSQAGGDRNAKHTYRFKNDRVIVHWLNTSPLRPSALRGLGAPQNTFANESFMDELAVAAGADPVEFRLRHLTDPRSRAVLEAVAKRADWKSGPSPQKVAGTQGLATGRGVSFIRYRTTDAYVAAIAEVEVNRANGRVRVKRVTVAHDCGLIINPNGLANQIEGNVIQAISRTLKEEVKFDRSRVTSLDWSSYPILTFPELPEDIEIALINRPDQPAVGAGEPTTCVIPAAIANAIFDATGARLRAIPFTPEGVKAALGNLSSG